MCLGGSPGVVEKPVPVPAPAPAPSPINYDNNTQQNIDTQQSSFNQRKLLAGSGRKSTMLTDSPVVDNTQKKQLLGV